MYPYFMLSPRVKQINTKTVTILQYLPFLWLLVADIWWHLTTYLEFHHVWLHAIPLHILHSATNTVSYHHSTVCEHQSANLTNARFAQWYPQSRLNLRANLSHLPLYSILRWLKLSCATRKEYTLCDHILVLFTTNYGWTNRLLSLKTHQITWYGTATKQLVLAAISLGTTMRQEHHSVVLCYVRAALKSSGECIRKSW